MTITYRCTMCNWTGPIPENAELLTAGKGRGHHVMTYRFDGSVHPLKRVRLTAFTQIQHQHLHQKRPNIKCQHCYPPIRSIEDQLNDFKKPPQSFAVPQTPASSEQANQEQDNHESRVNPVVPAVRPPATTPDEADIEVLAARLRKRFLNEQLDESEWTEDSISKI